MQTYSFEVGHVGCTDWCSNKTDVVDACFVGAVLVVFNEHLHVQFYPKLSALSSDFLMPNYP